MRKLFILRGAPASGKSTWVRENDLEEFTISSDNIRLLLSSPEMDINSVYSISQEYNKLYRVTYKIQCYSKRKSYRRNK